MARVEVTYIHAWGKMWRGGGEMKKKIQSSPDGSLARCTAEPTGDCPVVVVVVSLLLSSFLSGFLSCFFWEPKHGKQPILYIPLLISACYPHSHTHTHTLLLCYAHFSSPRPYPSFFYSTQALDLHI